MNVLLTHERFLPDFGGGGERIVYETARHLMRRGVQVRVVTTGDPRVTADGGVPNVRLPVSRYRFNLALRTILDHARTWIEPFWTVPVYLLAVFGLFLVPRAFAALVLMILAYNTALAALFVGETRYRVPWDFVIMLLAAWPLSQLSYSFSVRSVQRSSGNRSSILRRPASPS